MWGLKLESLGPGITIIYFPTSNPFCMVLGRLVFHIGGVFIPIMIILYCYNKVYQTLKQDCGFESRISPTRIFLYISVPIFCFVPWMLMEMFAFLLFDTISFPTGIMISILRKSWGALNLIVFWVLIPEQGSKDSFLSSGMKLSMNRSILDEKEFPDNSHNSL